MGSGASATGKAPAEAAFSASVPEKTGSERSAFALTTSETVAEEAPSPSATRLAVSVALV